MATVSTQSIASLLLILTTSVKLAISAGTIIGRVSRKSYNLGMGCSCSVDVVGALIVHDRVMPAVNAALAAIFLWLWWKSGGDDDTKKRWRKFKKKFEGVRRTAPVMA